jgi:Pex14 N-terminal domain
VRDASREKKVAFLKQKRLQNDEIQKLLDMEPASSDVQHNDGKTIHDSSLSSSSVSPSSAPTKAEPSTPSSEATPTPQPKPDIPPIITYPEFLFRPTKPPPLITLERLSYTLYTLAGISAITYGASKYLIQPMLQSLTSSRHDLASTALHNLEKMNEKLEGNVSHIPAMSNSLLLKQRGRERHLDNDNTSEIESIDSDPTELFHRDIATQTSPHLTRSPSTASSSSKSSSSSSLTTPSTHPKDATATQSTRLHSLSTALSSLLTTSSTLSTTQTNLLDTIADTQSYLDKLQYSNNSYLDYHFLYGSTPQTKDDKTISGGGKAGAKRGEEEQEDEAMRFRHEIRSVKGALLSGRNFPAGRPATAGMGAGVGVR